MANIHVKRVHKSNCTVGEMKNVEFKTNTKVELASIISGNSCNML